MKKNIFKGKIFKASQKSSKFSKIFALRIFGCTILHLVVVIAQISEPDVGQHETGPISIPIRDDDDDDDDDVDMRERITKR